MKAYRLNMIFIALLAIVANSAFAQSTIVTETKTWKSVPITVDTSKNVYTVTGVVPTDTTEYYYTYAGHRCFTVKRDIAGVNAIVLNAGVSGGTEIYCYPE